MDLSSVPLGLSPTAETVGSSSASRRRSIRLGKRPASSLEVDEGLRYKPTVPEKAVELCPETMACPAQGRDREFMMQSRERYVAGYEPCTLPPPFTAEEAREMRAREENVRSKITKMMRR